MVYPWTGILEEDRNDEDNEATVKAKYFYQSCMDMSKCCQAGHDQMFSYRTCYYCSVACT